MKELFYTLVGAAFFVLTLLFFIFVVDPNATTLGAYAIMVSDSLVSAGLARGLYLLEGK